MVTTIIKRIIQTVIVLAAVLVITFIILRLIPGDPIRTLLGHAKPEVMESMREEMGLNDSIPVQLVNYIKNIFNGDFGFSYFCKDTVMNVINNSYKVTVLLIVLSLPVSIIIGLILGVLCAVYEGTIVDKGISAFAVFINAAPNYWVAIMLIRIAAVGLGWLPASGYRGFEYAILPATVLALPLIGAFARNVRLQMIGAMRQNYSKAANARGIPRKIVLLGYSLRSIYVPFLTLIGSELGYLVGNCLLVESIFGYPGLGLTTVNAILRRDYFLVQGLVIILSALFIIINTIIDLSYAYLDPRIRKSQGGL